MTIFGRKANAVVRGRQEATRSVGRGWKQIFHPYVLSIAALSIALFTWGLGYKMERIHSGSDTVRQVLVAKLWVKPRGALVAAVPLSSVKTHLNSGASAFLTVNQQLPQPPLAAVLRSAAETQASSNANLGLSSRAPPIHRPFFA